MSVPDSESKVGGWWVGCPGCGRRAPLDEYEPSCADECACPACGCFFQFEPPEDEDGDEEGGEP